MTDLATLHAALTRVNAHIAAATCSVAIGDLLRVRASIREQIKQKEAQ